MAVGYPVTTTDINNTAGRLSAGLRDAFLAVVTFEAWLLATPDATLLAAPYSMAQADINILKSAFSDMNQLNNIRLGTVNLAVAKDFTTFAKQLTGIN